MDGVQWQRFSFRPDIPLGKFASGWTSNSSSTTTAGFPTKDGISPRPAPHGIPLSENLLRPVRHEERSFSCPRRRARRCDTRVRPHHGRLPEHAQLSPDKKLGIEFGATDIGTFGLGIEGVVNSIGDIRNKGAVVGVRVSARPFKPSGASLFEKLTSAPPSYAISTSSRVSRIRTTTGIRIFRTDFLTTRTSGSTPTVTG